METIASATSTSAASRAGAAARATRARGPRSACRRRSASAASASSGRRRWRAARSRLRPGQRRRRASRRPAPRRARRCSSPTSTRASARWPTRSARAGWRPTRRSRPPVDVFAPCALGGLLDHESVRALQAPIVAGAANNQLADDDVAAVLAERGVLWAPDFVVNAGGIINISVELEPAGYDPRRAGELVRGIGATLRADLRRRAATARRVTAGGGDGARPRAPRRRRRLSLADRRNTTTAPTDVDSSEPFTSLRLAKHLSLLTRSSRPRWRSGRGLLLRAVHVRPEPPISSHYRAEFPALLRFIPSMLSHSINACAS